MPLPPRLPWRLVSEPRVGVHPGARVMLRHLLPPWVLSSSQPRGFLQQKRSRAIIRVIFGAEGKGRTGGAVSSKEMPRERDFALGNGYLAKTNALDKAVVWWIFFCLFVFKSRVEFLAKKREKTTSQNSKQPHGHGMHQALLL